MLHGFDIVAFGRHLQAARVLAGVRDLRTLAAMLSRAGVLCTASHLRAYEQGLMVPTCDVFLGLVVVLDPPGGVKWFWSTYGAEVNAELRRLDEASSR